MQMKALKKEEDSHDHEAQISRAEIWFIISEAICILFYGLFTEFDMYTTPKILPENEYEAINIAQSKYAFF